jgi:DNA-binding PadR family transcriptional regulator
MGKGNHIGELEELVLLTISYLGEEAYGVSILEDIENRTGRSMNVSAIHAVLKRLENKGFVESYMGGATKERGGRRKRFFKLTTSGRVTVEESMKVKIELYKHLSPSSI